MKYEVTIKEALGRAVFVEADSLDEAVEKVKEMYYQSKVVLDADDYLGTTFYYKDSKYGEEDGYGE